MELETGPAGMADEALAEGLRGLVDALRERWGDPRTLVLGGFADPSLDEDRGLSLVTPFGGLLLEMCGWAVRRRWVGCGIARDEAGSQLRLVAVVGDRVDPALRCLPDDGRDWAGTTWLERLAAVTGWETPQARSIDWPSVEARLGSPLPTDYQRLAERFGSGEFDGFLGLCTPDSPAGRHDLVTRALKAGELASADPGSRDLHSPYRLFPAPGGLLQWADSVQGDQFFWLTGNADPDRWPVVACNDDGDIWAWFEGSTTEFVHRVLTDDRHPFSVARHFERHSFSSSGRG
ncbi:hypothetical protein ABT095_04435 [Kitasatospora sp. NPDC002227]|uniref:hypothetical protein n=1 Tax=Kitasatospora sp. NPDC002227 TaxID=3154773 RepID=UPI0033217818